MNRKLTMLAAAILSLAACTQQAKPRYIWIDASANFTDFANSKENIERDIIKAKEAGFTDLVVDVRPTNGNVLFRSREGIPYTERRSWRGVYERMGHRVRHAGPDRPVSGRSHVPASG